MYHGIIPNACLGQACRACGRAGHKQDEQRKLDDMDEVDAEDDIQDHDDDKAGGMRSRVGMYGCGGDGHRGVPCEGKEGWGRGKAERRHGGDGGVVKELW